MAKPYPGCTWKKLRPYSKGCGCVVAYYLSRDFHLWRMRSSVHAFLGNSADCRFSVFRLLLRTNLCVISNSAKDSAGSVLILNYGLILVQSEQLYARVQSLSDCCGWMAAAFRKIVSERAFKFATLSAIQAFAFCLIVGFVLFQVCALIMDSGASE